MRNEEEIRNRLDEILNTHRTVCKRHMDGTYTTDEFFAERTYTVGELKTVLWILDQDVRPIDILVNIENEEGIWT